MGIITLGSEDELNNKYNEDNTSKEETSRLEYIPDKAKDETSENDDEKIEAENETIEAENETIKAENETKHSNGEEGK